MQSSRSKVLHVLFGKSIIEYCFEAVRGSRITKILIVAGKNHDDLKVSFGKTAKIIFQKERLGTGHAVMCTSLELKRFQGDLLVAAGDAPLILTRTLERFCREHSTSGAYASVLTAELDEPQGYGRILRDGRGHVLGIREDLDASPLEKKIREVNSGIYLFRAKELFQALKEIRPVNRKKEYYLTDVVEVFCRRGLKVQAYPLAQGEEILGINTRKDLVKAAKEIWKRNIEFQLERGVTVVSPDTTYIESDVTIGRDTVVHPFSYVEKDVVIGKNCQIGPFCKIRSGSRIKDGAVIGSFVELVRSSVGENSMVKHLAYLGDAELGSRVNIGAGTVTANYDGRKKHKTRIGNRAFVGCNTVLIAPVSVGEGARTGAGSVIPKGKNVPAGTTVIGVPARVLKKRNRA